MINLNNSSFAPKLFLFIIFYGVLNSCHAQNLLISDSLVSYYHYTNLAEISITESKFEQAINSYEEAFKFKKSPFCVDKYNKGLCESKLRNYKSTYVSLEYIVRHGFKVDSLERIPVLNDFFMTKYGRKLTRRARCNNVVFNQRLHYLYDSLYTMDQQFRQPFVVDGVFNNYVRSDTLRIIDSLNTLMVKELIDEFGVPNEQQVGLYENAFYNGRLGIIIFHNTFLFGGGDKKLFRVDFKDVISDGIYNGQLDIRSYQSLYESVHGQHIFGTSYDNIIRCSMFDSTKVDGIDLETQTPMSVFKLPVDEKLKKINLARKNVGLPTLEDARKKLSYQINNQSYFYFSGVTNTYSDVPTITFIVDYLFENFKKQLIYLE